MTTTIGRVPWFTCACCPPNVMRTLASLEHYVTLGGDDRGLVVGQYVSGAYTVGRPKPAS